MAAENIRKLADLARISLGAEEEARLAADFESVLGYVSQLEALDVEGSGDSLLPYRNIFREDKTAHESGAWTKEIVDAFPRKEGNSLSVKQIISHD